MCIVRTILGDIDPNDLGITLCHEHLVLNISPEQVLTEEEVNQELLAYTQLGGKSIVEMTNTGMGRDISALRELAENTHLNIIASTGFYKQSHYPPYIKQLTIDEIVEGFVREIREGIDNTEIKAGVIGEIGTSREAITPDEEKVLRASARAARITGAPLSTHTSFGEFALEQIQILIEEGLPLHRVSIGHLDLIPDPDYHTLVAEQGAFVQYDTFGKNQYERDENRVNCLLEMITRGFGHQILLSVDITRVSYLRAYGGWGYSHILTDIVPVLRRSGLEEEIIHQLLIENPKRFLSFDIPAH